MNFYVVTIEQKRHGAMPIIMETEIGKATTLIDALNRKAELERRYGGKAAILECRAESDEEMKAIKEMLTETLKIGSDLVEKSNIYLG